MREDILSLSVTELIKKLEAGEVTSTQATSACLERIKKSKINAIVHLNENALEEAKEADKKRKDGDSSKLLGVPIVLKANMATVGSMPTSCCSKYLKDFLSPYEATVVSKLRAEGAVILGKANMDEFAFGSSNESSYFGACKNPHDITRVPGGSSGGSAAAVADNLCFAALGSDTGGSIRQPASLCGVVGLKPTYGSVSRKGLVAFASSLDQIGPLAKTVEDAALLFEVIMGEDKKDSTCNRRQETGFVKAIGKSVRGLKIGVAREYFSLPTQPDVESCVNAAIEFYKANGAEIVDISLPNVDKALSTYYILASAEAASNLSRFDGMRYGERVLGEGLVDTYYKTRTDGFGKETKRRIMLGNYVLSSGFYDAYYKKATKVQQVLKDEFAEAFKKCDVIISPASPQVAWRLGEKTSPLANYLSDIFTVPANITGKPAISFPCGKGENNLPVGLQLIADDNREDLLFTLASFYEKNKGENYDK